MDSERKTNISEIKAIDFNDSVANISVVEDDYEISFSVNMDSLIFPDGNFDMIQYDYLKNTYGDGRIDIIRDNFRLFELCLRDTD